MSSIDDRVQTRVVIRPLASGLPLGFFAFATGMFMTGALQLGLIDTSFSQSVYLMLLAFVVPLQFTSSLLALAARDTVAATALGVFAGSWAVFAVSGLAASAPTSDAVGFYSIALAVLAAVMSCVAVLGQKLVAAVLILATVRSGFYGAYHLTQSPALETVAGVLSMVIAVVAVYGSLALLLEEATGRSVLPFGRRGKALRAMEDSSTANLERIHSEPGVRPRL